MCLMGSATGQQRCAAQARRLLGLPALQGPLPECPTDCFSRLDELSLKQNRCGARALCAIP